MLLIKNKKVLSLFQNSPEITEQVWSLFSEVYYLQSCSKFFHCKGSCRHWPKSTTDDWISNQIPITMHIL